MTEPRLEAALVRWLDNWGGTVSAARKMLRRNVDRSVKRIAAEMEHGPDEALLAKRDAAYAIVEDLINRYHRAGLLDDAAWAAGRMGRMRRSGASAMKIRGALAAKGVPQEVLQDTLRAAPPDAEAAAAEALARRRRLGPYRAPELRKDHRAKDLAVLGRAGFSWHLASSIIDRAGDEPNPD
jgi:regulatory protein